MFRSIVTLALAAALACTAHAQTYPSRPIRMIVPFPAGGTADLAARLISQDVASRIGQQIVVDNKSGGSTIIGTEMAVKAAPDGYTLVNVPFNYATNPYLFKKLPYDSVTDLKPVVLLGLTPIVLVVHPSLPAQSVKGLIALAKATPGKLNYASAGEGSSNHLATELFKMRNGVDFTHIPYKGAAPGVSAVASGEVALMFSGLTSALAQIQSGRLRALAVASSRRTVALPAVVTLNEVGISGCEASAWHGTMAPRKTSAAIVDKLNSEMSRSLRTPAVADKLIAIGFEPAGGSPSDFERFIRSEMDKWSKVVRAANIKAGAE